MPQFSLRALLAIVAIAAIGICGLSNPTRGWNFAIVSLAMTITSLVSLHAICSRSRLRSFSIGFAFAAWTYFALLACDVEYSLATTWLLEESFTFINPDNEMNMTHYGIFFVGPNGFPRLTNYSNYLHIGHGLWMLAVGYLGGAAAQYFTIHDGDAAKSADSVHETIRSP